ncbi:MAG: hypothetical protein SCALA702_38290 [Melioribacteraceae bacterium]|nr:MAG: hypothetical protein SCALA702_38290 [Melioribacteraceae bacterium]
MDPAVVDDYFIYNALKWFVLIVAGLLAFLFVFFKLKARVKKNSEIPVEVKKKERPPDFLGRNAGSFQTEYHYVSEDEHYDKNNPPETESGY